MNSKKHIIMIFILIYKLALSIFQMEKCRRRLSNIKNADTVKKIICQNKILLKIDLIVI